MIVEQLKITDHKTIHRKLLACVMTISIIYICAQEFYLSTIFNTRKQLTFEFVNERNSPFSETNYTCSNNVSKSCFYHSLMQKGMNGNNFGLQRENNTFCNRDKKLIIKKTSTLCNRFITIGAHLGRIGNQMFQIASLLGTAVKHDFIPLIPDDYTIKRYFDLPNIVNRNTINVQNVVNCTVDTATLYKPCTTEINTGQNLSIYGYFQSWKYFHESRNVIKSVFKFKRKFFNRARNFFSRMSLKGYRYVCIHVRRGDVTAQSFRKLGVVLAGADYIEKAKNFYKRKYSKVQFVVVSNDKDWCRRHIKEVIVSNLTDPGDELALMVQCDDVIITTGTFGWWGAWLSGGTTVYFNKHPRPGSYLSTRIKKRDYFPPNWIGFS